ncbi:MAG: NlpC/P60 family protein [Nocardioides sp.]|uniref:C40 family peptidase n=1 Tax=Nocardioides sp. TaxID=35761 RepID=UPI0039E2FF6B
MPHGRKRFLAAFAAVAALASFGLIQSTPGYAAPSIDDVQKRVDRLYDEAEQAAERHNNIQLKLEDLRADLSAMQADEQRQQRRLSVVQTQVADSIVRQYQGEGLSTVGQVVVSDDPSGFLGELSTVSAVTDVQTGLYADYATQLKALDIKHSATAKRTKQITAAEKESAEAKATADKKLSEAQAELDKLKEEQRQELLSNDGSTVAPSNVPASGRAAAAVHYALAQVGKAYVYGAAGPNAFDCSGLTMASWAQAGVGLPHSSSAQFGSGPHISEGALRPGDLVFYYSPIHHVGMYIGNGLIVHAANPGAGVRVAPLHSMPYVGAVRPG